jgi:hypothetical protein
MLGAWHGEGMPARKQRPAVPCHLCAESTPSETDLVVHLVENHEAVWASTNSFGLEDLMIPAPREAYHDEVTDEPGVLRRLLARRTG